MRQGRVNRNLMGGLDLWWRRIRFVCTRLLWNSMVAVIFISASFWVMFSAPPRNDICCLCPPPPPEVGAYFEENYGAKPIWQQYLTYMRLAFFEFDLGYSVGRSWSSVQCLLFDPDCPGADLYRR
jgi:ABC-type dipeptide/oligopeptide/nickel transport system permease component